MAAVIKMKVIEPCIFAPAGGESQHLAAGDVVECSAEDALALAGSGRAEVVTGKLPNKLKPGKDD